MYLYPDFVVDPVVLPDGGVAARIDSPTLQETVR
jgi:hypothetical protein